MATGDNFVNVVDKRLLGFQDIRDRFFQYLQKYSRDIHQTAYGMDGVFGGSLINIQAHGAGKIQMSIDPLCSDGGGHFLKTTTDDLNGRTTGISFENTNTVVYFVAYHYAERPRVIQQNPATGLPEFVSFEETIGNSADPGSVVNNGANLTFNIDAVAQPFGGVVHSYAGRKCLVWKKAPGKLALTESAAVELCTVAFGAGANTITTTTLLGQPVGGVSVLTSDYEVLVLGPTISSTNDLSIQAGYMYVGTVTGNAGVPVAFSNAGQNDLSSGFAVDLNQVTRLDADGHLKLRVRAVAGDTNVKQNEVQDSTGTSKWWIDESGNQFVLGIANLLGNVIIGTDHNNQHALHGRLRQLNDVAGVLVELLGTGELGLGGAAVASVALKTYLRTIIGDDDAQLHDLRGDLRARSNGAATTAEIRSLDGRAGFGGAAPGSGPFGRFYGDSQTDRTSIVGTSQLADTAANDALIPRRDLGSAVHTAMLVDRWQNLDGTYSRVYAFQLGSFIKTVNAYWDGAASKWTKDTNGVAASAHQQRFDVLAVSQKTAGNNTPWVLGGWDTETSFPVGPGVPAVIAANVYPDATGKSLGQTGQSWNAWLHDGIVDSTLKPIADNQALGGSGVNERWKAFLHDADVSGDLFFTAIRTFRKILFPRSSEVTSIAGGTWTFTGSVATTPFRHIFTWDTVNPAQLTIIAQLPHVPDGAVIVSVIFHWRTGTTATSDMFYGVYRQANDSNAGTPAGFNSGANGEQEVLNPAANTNRNDAVTINTAAGNAAIDNDTYSYFALFAIADTGGMNNMQLFSIEVVYTMDRVRF